MLVYKDLRERASPDDRVLDVGTKDGRHLSGVDGDVIAVDLELEPSFDAVQYVVADGYELPFGSDTFDYVVSNQVLEHVEQKGTLLDEMARVLAPDGLLLLSFPNRLFPIDPHGFPPGFPLLPRPLAVRVAKRLSAERYEYYRDHAFYLSARTGRSLLEGRFGSVEYVTPELVDRFPETFESTTAGRVLLRLRPLIDRLVRTDPGRQLFELTYPYVAYRCRLGA